MPKNFADPRNPQCENVRPSMYNLIPAALWSIVFSPIFGAVIVQANWKALRNSQASARSRLWIIGLCALYLSPVYLLFTNPAGFHFISWQIQLGAGVAWLFLDCLPQLKQINELPEFRKKSWRKPLGIAFSIWLGSGAILYLIAVITAPPPPILDASSPEAYEKTSQAVILYLEQTRINPLRKKCQTEFLLSREEKQEAKAFNSLKYLLEEGNKREMNGLNANQLMDYVKAKIENAKKMNLPLGLNQAGGAFTSLSAGTYRWWRRLRRGSLLSGFRLSVFS